MATTSLPTRPSSTVVVSRLTRRFGRLLAAIVVVVLFPLVFGLGPEDFANVFQFGILRFISLGAIATITASLVAILLSLPLATLLALARFARGTPQHYLSTVVIEGIRAVPVLLVIVYVSRQFPGIGLERMSLSGAMKTLFGALFSSQGQAVVVALTLYTAVVNAELIRSGMASLDRGQFEAARSLGMSYAQMMRLVILPQTFRRILPPLIAQFTTLVKDTSLGYVVGFVELQKAAQIIYQQPGYSPMAVLYVTALIYFVINYVLGKVSLAIQQRRGGLPPHIDMG
ncbi:MAG TPA: amino acid ABC transporter permease [Herpetosiphonaceae bacterium]